MKKINMLSGGERGRLSLAKLMLSNANFLILDEPTNHLDIQSKEILEAAINSYQGTVLFVSHDRYFIQKTANRILELNENKIDNYIGGYEFFLKKKEEKKELEKEQMAEKDKASLSSTIDSSTKIDWTKKKEDAAKERKLQTQIKKTELLIEKLESKKEELETKMGLPENCSDSSKLHVLSEKLNRCIIELEDTMDIWSSLQEEL